MKTENKLVNVVQVVLVEGEVKHEYLPLQLLLPRDDYCNCIWSGEKARNERKGAKESLRGIINGGNINTNYGKERGGKKEGKERK